MARPRDGAPHPSPGQPDADWLERLLDLIAAEYGWTDRQVFDAPLVGLLRRIRIIRVRRIDERLRNLTDTLWPWADAPSRQRLLARLHEDRNALAPRLPRAEDYVADPAIKEHIRRRRGGPGTPNPRRDP